MSANDLTVQKRFEVDLQCEDAAAFVEDRKAALEKEARQKLDESMGKTLADF